MENSNYIFFDDDKEKRKIDDPELNQESPYDPNEAFDDTDDFHKNDDTAKEQPSKSDKE